jgi:hypothetical protein
VVTPTRFEPVTFSWTALGVPCRRSQIRLEAQIWAKPTDGLKHPQVAGFRFAGPRVAEHIETDVHALNKADDPAALDTADVHENIRATIIGLDEAVSLFGVKELHYSASQLLPPLIENPPPNVGRRVTLVHPQRAPLGSWRHCCAASGQRQVTPEINVKRDRGGDIGFLR